MYTYILIGVIGLIVLWAVGSYLVVRAIEKPAYTVLEKRNGYEIREYAPYIVAETTVTGDYDQATRAGFRLVADYIFGNNTAKASISMTSPVLENAAQTNSSEKIAMTSPVIESPSADGQRTIAFVLPSKYTLETLPLPNNPAVTLREVPAQKVAALTFSWYPTALRMEKMKTKLNEALLRDQVTPTGGVQTARYNPPLSMPLMVRNEILVPLE